MVRPKGQAATIAKVTSMGARNSQADRVLLRDKRDCVVVPVILSSL